MSPTTKQAVTPLPETNNDTEGDQRRYTAIYRSGSQGYFLVQESSWDAFVADWKRAAEQHLRLINVETFAQNGQRWYVGVYTQGKQDYSLVQEASWDTFVTYWKQASEQGLRLIDIETFEQNGQRWYIGVYLQGSGKYSLVQEASWDAFVTYWKQAAEQGLRLIDVESFEQNGQRWYIGVYTQGKGGYSLVSYSSYSEFLKNYKQARQDGLGLVDLDTFAQGPSRSYVAAYRADNKDHRVAPYSNWYAFTEGWKQVSAQKMRLQKVTTYADSLGPWGRAIYRYLKVEAVGFSYAIRQHGQLVEFGGVGWARANFETDDPDVVMTAEQLVTIGSISKTVTTVAMLALMQQRSLTLNTPFYALIENSPRMKGVVLSDQRVRNITLGNLMTQSSGFAGVPDGDWNNPSSLWNMIKTQVSNALPAAKQPAGSTYEYLNTNFGLLRGVIEVVSGQGYEAYVREHVLEPLGMTQTNIQTGTSNTLYYAAAQRAGSGTLIPRAASWRSTSREMVEFLRGLRDNTVLNAESRAAMLRTYVIPKQWYNQAIHDEPKQVQLGLYPGTVGDISYTQHNGAYNLSEGRGSFSGVVLFDDPSQTDVCILINTAVPNNVQPVAIIPGIYDELRDQ